MSTFKKIFVGLLCSLVFAFTVNGQELEKWSSSNPDASDALGNWIKRYPAAANYIVAWDVNHPDRSQALVAWAAANYQLSADNFHQLHKDWAELDTITTMYMDATRAFLKLSRAYNTEITSLMTHPGGLKWESEHLSVAATTETTK